MKNARAPLSSKAMKDPGALLTTGDAARLLRVHPKHVYRLLRQGLPGRRVGGEWRFLAAEVLRWSGSRAPAGSAAGDGAEDRAPQAPAPFLAANGDMAVERLLSLLNEGAAAIGSVQADRCGGLDLLRRGAVLAAGYHGGEIPATLGGHRLAFIDLVDRQVGLALRDGVRVRGLRQLSRWRFASRPETAGVRAHFDEAAIRQGADPLALHARARIFPSHREVVCAVARGEADVGLATEAWTRHVGLRYVPLCRETYGLLVRASALGDPRVVRLCEVAQGARYRRDVGAVAGYGAGRAGTISYRAPRAAAP